MYFSILFFSSLHFFVDSLELKRLWNRNVPVNHFDGFKHIPAYELFTKWTLVSNLTELRRFTCVIRSCHNENKNNCKMACDQFARKYDEEYNNYIWTLNESFQPSVDLKDCKNRCTSFCGKNDCTKECASLCLVQFSYANRKEYEAEYFDMLKRFHDVVV